jgi:hypothetical protein
MHLMKRIKIAVCLICPILIIGCGPKTVNTDSENLNPVSEAWIPYEGSESIVYEYDTLHMTFAGDEKESYYESVRYMTDQGGFIGGQKDYYADLERKKLIFNSVETPYFIQYHLERNKGELGDWDIFRVSVGDGDYYQNEMKIVTYETESSDKGENFTFKREMLLNGVNYDSVYFKKQERRPFEVYYTLKQGVIGFKVSATELWTLKQDTIK